MKNQLELKYNHHTVEDNKYDFWLKHKLFDPNPKYKETFSIILPPPNVTGKLHLGHAWDVSLQDVLIRYNKLLHKNVIWIPGTDHAGIATQTKFEKILKDKTGQTASEIGRKQFLTQLWDWATNQSNFIHEQWKKMGIALAYDYEKFTLDEDVKTAVNFVFVELYKQGLIYKKKKLVNWDPVLKTAISNIEVIHKETNSKMYYFKYYSEDKNDFVIVATTRPETMFGDVCLVANPNDNRYTKFKNTKFINPANNELIPLIFDEYVDQSFGTGIMKCTPGHDFNDYEIAKIHNLRIINIFNPDATMNELVAEYSGIDRLDCRDLLVKQLESQGLLDHIENIVNQVGYSERTNSIVEPYLSWQWFVDIKQLAKKVIDTQENDTNKTEFEPKRLNTVLLKWLENIDDWCISRQLWWGHQIPIWYNKHTNEIYCDTNPPNDVSNWVQDEDVLDTWFSSGLWPLVTLGWPNKTELFEKYFPTSVLVTGYDIIFFWVSRMMMFSKHFTNLVPFKNVLIHGLIRDQYGRKMSKSLGNGIDPMDVIDQYGCDSLRLFLTTTATLGEDLNYSDEKLKSNWNFLNKLWNGSRYIIQLLDENKNYELTHDELLNLTNLNSWIVCKLNKLIVEINKNMNNFNFVVGFKKIYEFVWDDFLNTYLELTKIDVKNNNELMIKILVYVLKQVLIILHPMCPFITEEIYQYLPNHLISIMNEKWPEKIEIKDSGIDGEYLLEILFAIRKLRTENNWTKAKSLSINLFTNSKLDLSDQTIKFFNKYLNTNNINIIDSKIQNGNNCITTNFKICIDTNSLIDKEIELKKLKDQLHFVESEISRCQNLLFNKNFIEKANIDKVNLEKAKLAKYQLQYSALKEKISQLKSLYISYEDN